MKLKQMSSSFVKCLRNKTLKILHPLLLTCQSNRESTHWVRS